MHAQQSSVFRRVSMGLVLLNQKPGANLIEVLPIEMMPFVDGELIPNPTINEDKGTDASGNEYVVKVVTSNSISAIWLRGQTNQITAPNVKRGELVELYKCADDEKYYWRSTGVDQETRDKETVVFAFAAHNEKNPTKLTAENSYFVEVSSHNKTITLSTTSLLEEAAEYIFQFNLAEGVVTLADNHDNFVELDSIERSFIAQNKDRSRIEMNKRRIFLTAGDQIEATTKYVDINCDTITINAKKLQGNILDSFFTGTMTIDKHVLMKQTLNVLQLATVGTFAMGPAAAAGGGPALATGTTTKMTFNIDVDFLNTNVKHNGVNIGMTHQHNETGLGGGITTPPI